MGFLSTVAMHLLLIRLRNAHTVRDKCHVWQRMRKQLLHQICIKITREILSFCVMFHLNSVVYTFYFFVCTLKTPYPPHTQAHMHTNNNVIQLKFNMCSAVLRLCRFNPLGSDFQLKLPLRRFTVTRKPFFFHIA